MGIEGDIALHDAGVQSMTLEFFLTPAASKKTAVIVARLKANFEHSAQLGFLKSHVNKSIWLSATGVTWIWR
jgi:hypothetical protein